MYLLLVVLDSGKKLVNLQGHINLSKHFKEDRYDTRHVQQRLLGPWELKKPNLSKSPLTFEYKLKL